MQYGVYQGNVKMTSSFFFFYCNNYALIVVFSSFDLLILREFNFIDLQLMNTTQLFTGLPFNKIFGAEGKSLVRHGLGPILDTESWSDFIRAPVVE